MLSSLNCTFQISDDKVLQVSCATQHIVRQFTCHDTPIAATRCGDDGQGVAILESSRMLRIYSSSGDVTSVHVPAPAEAIFSFSTGLLIECRGDNVFPGVTTAAHTLYTLAPPYFALRPVQVTHPNLTSRIKCINGDFVVTWSNANNGELHLHRLSRVPLMENGLPNTSHSLASPDTSRTTRTHKPSFRAAAKSNRCSTPTNISTVLGVSPSPLTSPAALSLISGSDPAPELTLVPINALPLTFSASCIVEVWDAQSLIFVCDRGVLRWFAIHNLHSTIDASVDNVASFELSSIDSICHCIPCFAINLTSGHQCLMLSPSIVTPALPPMMFKRNYRISHLSSSLLTALMRLPHTDDIISSLIPFLVAVYQVNPVAAIPCVLRLLHGETDLTMMRSYIGCQQSNGFYWEQAAAHLVKHAESCTYARITIKDLLREMIIAGFVDVLFSASELSLENSEIYTTLNSLGMSADNSVSIAIDSIKSAIQKNNAQIPLFSLLCPVLNRVISSLQVGILQEALLPSLSLAHKLLLLAYLNSADETPSPNTLCESFIAILKSSKKSVTDVLSMLPPCMRVVIAMSLTQTLSESEDGTVLQQWSEDLLRYVGRDDLVMNLHPPSFMPTAPTGTDVDGLKTCELIGGDLFPADERMMEVCRMLRATAPLYLRVDRPPEMSDAAHRLKLQQRLLALARRSLAGAVGRGMVTIASHHALVAESLPIPSLCLSGRIPPSNAIINLDASIVTSDLLSWPEFHNGVAAGMRVRGSVTRNWILYNKSLATTAAAGAETSSALNGHAGSLLALGLRGYLGVLTASDICEYLTMNYDSTTIAVLLGCAASKLGSCDTLLSKSLCLHLPSLVYNQASELSIPHLIQCTSIVGLGLLHCRSGGRLIVEFLLKEISRCGDECHDGIVFASGMALGLLLLGYGQEDNGKLRKSDQLSDLAIEDRLQRCISGGERGGTDMYGSYRQSSGRSLESNLINVNATAPAAIIALALMYIKSNNSTVLGRLALPRTAYEIDSIRPDLLVFLAMANCLVRWSEVSATEEWLQCLMPKLIRDVLFGGPVMLSGKASSISRRTALQSFLCIIAGTCWGLAFVYAGTANCDAKGLLLKQLRLLQSLRDGTNPPAATYALWHEGTDEAPVFLKAISDKASRSIIELCMIQVSVSLGMVCAGSGDVDVLRQLRVLRWRVEDVSYGTHMGLGMAMGFLFLGSGRMSLKRDDISIASLVISTCPRYPSRSQDNSTHLQPLRHLYALAVEERCLLCKDMVNGESQRIAVEVRLRSKEVELRETPCLLPELSSVECIVSQSDVYHTTTLPISASNAKPLVIYVRKRPTNSTSALEQRLNADLLELRSQPTDDGAYALLQKKWQRQIVTEWAMSPLFGGEKKNCLLEIALLYS